LTRTKTEQIEEEEGVGGGGGGGGGGEEEEEEEEGGGGRTEETKSPLRPLADMYSPHFDTSSTSDSRRYGSSHLAPKLVNRAKGVLHTYGAHST
jgi:hypothetical protein